MIRVEELATVKRPPPEVFAYLANLDNIARWQSEVVTSKVTSSGPVGVGTRFSETVKIGPWRLVAECAVTDYQQDRQFGFSADSKPVAYQGRFEVEPSSDGTRLVLEGTFRLKGAWRLLQPLLASDLRKGARGEMETIKRQLEAPA